VEPAGQLPRRAKTSTQAKSKSQVKSSSQAKGTGMTTVIMSDGSIFPDLDPKLFM
jgi:hypothetical protein